MIRSGYSFHVAAGHMKDVVSRVKEVGMTSLPLTDRNSTFGFVEMNKMAKEAELRPVFGAEFGVVPNKSEKKPRPDYWKFLTKTSLRQLHDLVAEATDIIKEPCLTYEEAMAAPGLFKITGERVLLEHLGRVVPGDVFIGLSPALPVATYREALRMGLRFVAISDNLFPREEDKEFYRITLGWRSTSQTYPQWILSDEEWRKAVGWFVDEEQQGLALLHRDYILHNCRASIKKASLLVAEKKRSLKDMCIDGARRLGCNLTDPVYRERLLRELKLIRDKNFEDYFYIIADAISYAKEEMIVGPARGSSCGSLVCYLLGITTVDPIPFGLIFERFIDVNRADLPDIDIDFDDTKRDMVFEYMREKYGHERVGRLGSVMTMGARSALTQLGKSLKIPTWMVNQVADGAIKRMAGDSRASSTIEDTVNTTDAGKRMLDEFPESKVVYRMEDHPTGAGQHAAGVVLTQEALAEYVAVNTYSGAVMCDKKSAEELNLLKIDVLGLTQLSVFARCLELIGQRPVNGYLESLPLDDEGAFRVLNEGKYAGVFQFMGSAVQRTAERIKITSLEDIIALGALARPGPLSSGGTDTWVMRKNGVMPISYAHDSLVPHTESTFGCILYQEQVMQIGREVGGLSWEDVSALRRAMSKSLGVEFFDKFGDPWKRGAIAKGWPEKDANQFWGEMIQFGAMAFNRAHSVAYGFISYWCAYLKAHHPLEFAAATMDMEGDADKQLIMLRELDKEGIKYIPIDPERSTDRWTIADGVLVGPLINAIGVGPKSVTEIMRCRRSGEELKPSLKMRLISAKTKIDSLTPISDAIKRLCPDILSAGIKTLPTPLSEVKPGIKSAVVLGVVTLLDTTDENAPVKVTKRKGKVFKGPTIALNMFLRDDEDELFCKVDRFDFKEGLGPKIFDRGGVNKSLWAFKGEVPDDFRMLKVKQAKYLGRIDDECVAETD